MGKNKDNEQMEALEALIDRGVIDEVIGVVKSGKEATVYCCRSGDGSRLLAAKAYRSRDVRRFSNDAAYTAGRHGRHLSLGSAGGGGTRYERAIAAKSRAGKRFAFGEWVAEEYATLRLLHARGVAVPERIEHSEQIIVMEYVGDDDGPAPTLNSVDIDGEFAFALWERLLANIELALSADRVHGDLSAHNVLWWCDAPLIIDFPQAVDPRFNHDALALLQRDIENLHRYFVRYGVQAEPWRIAHDMWGRFLRSEL